VTSLALSGAWQIIRCALAELRDTEAQGVTAPAE
jgi:hypothetical protein